MLQLIIATVLLFVLFFGLGFILNMLMKTTWFPIYGYIVLIIGLVIYYGWGSDSVWSAVAGYSLVDMIAAIGGLVGAVLSGSAIKMLRDKGFKMF
ncbi:YuiB family protein [Paenibacillus filicis]|uniref:YuiB family protein n=1 Tax=Paenibacillus gyeongsangnamensis TaxID=3388067 RepID=A0ABT4QIV3_9BACL|nr:YuiB family protein [Paenibacillus filicis]MCZ8516804.1 YuiB family protein [Paenibacillus filicis]